MQLIICIYLCIAFFAFIAYLCRHLFAALPAVAVSALVIASLPFYLLYAMLFKTTRHNVVGVVFFIVCMAIVAFICLRA